MSPVVFVPTCDENLGKLAKQLLLKYSGRFVLNHIVVAYLNHFVEAVGERKSFLLISQNDTAVLVPSEHVLITESGVKLTPSANVIAVESFSSILSS